MSYLYLTIDDIKYSITIILMQINFQNKSKKLQETSSVSANLILIIPLCPNTFQLSYFFILSASSASWRLIKK
jgi:hypothetical protein